MFYLYKSKDFQYLNTNFYKNLNILRLDCTEEDIFNYRCKNDIPYKIEDIKYKPLKNIAFISNDFSLLRPSGILAKDFFKNLLKKNLSIFLISQFKICKPFNLFKNFTSKDHSKIEEYIKEKKIDILIDMQGHMINNYSSVLEKRLARIQIHFLGYPGTLGLSCIDYLIADKTIIPKKSTKFYKEKIAYMPNCYQVNSESNLLEKKPTNYNIFKLCCFNSHYKLDKKGVFVWIQILKKAPNTVLFLIDGIYKNIIYKYAKYYKVSKRIIFLKKTTHEKHIKRLTHMDLGLDTYRLNGHTTSSDLITAGVPLITYTGETFHNRVSKSILNSLELEELVCYSFKEYIELTVKIASNPKYHNKLIHKVKTLREKTLFNSKLYTDDFINLLHSIWSHHFTNELNNNDDFTITKFGNKINQNYEWNYVPYLKLDQSIDYKLESLLDDVKYRGQILRNFADNINDCNLFTTCGLLYTDKSLLEIKMLKSDNYNEGIWVKSKINIQNNLEIYNKINKDYNEPLTIIFYYFKGETKNVNKIIQYVQCQTYLNVQIVIYCDKFNLKYLKLYNNLCYKLNIKILSVDECNFFILKNKNTNKLLIHEKNINKILNNINYINEQNNLHDI